MKCIPCTKINQTQMSTVAYYKSLPGDWWVYKTAKGELKFMNGKSFKVLFEKEIKPNLKNGAEYFNIREFTAN